MTTTKTLGGTAKQAFKRVKPLLDVLKTDIRAPERFRLNAQAWIDLFSESRTEKGLSILKEFASELADNVGAEKSTKRIVKDEKSKI